VALHPSSICTPYALNTAQMKRPLALRTSCLWACSPGQPAPRVHSCPIILKLYSRNREMSWLIIAGGIFWSTKSWCSACGIRHIPRRIRISGLLVRKTRRRTVFNNRASAKSCRIICTFLPSSHSSSASTMRTYEHWQALQSSFASGWRTSWRHWSRRDCLATSLRLVITW
jgi:hypothetical protein